MERCRLVSSDSAASFARFPRQFWVLTLGIFIYVGAAALAFPFEAHLPAPYLGTRR